MSGGELNSKLFNEIYKLIIMSRILYLIILSAFVAFFISSCKKMDSTYKKYVVPEGITYPGKATSPMVYVGRERVKISWLRGTDPTVTKARIYWDNYTDSVEIKIPDTGDTINTIIDNLPEKSYTFIIRTFDDDGNISVPVEVLSATYGDKYQGSLLNRPVTSAILDDRGNVTIEWGSADISNGAIASEIEYTDTLGEKRVDRFPVSEEESEVKGIKPGSAINFRTVFIPDTLSIDTFYTAYEKDSLIYLDKSNWSILDFSSEYPGREDTKVGRIIDGDPTTRWHTWVGHSTYPEFVTVDMKVDRVITYFEIYRDNGDDRACTSFQLFVSTDDVNWTDLGVFPFNPYTDDGQWYEIPSHPTARYWKFVGLTGTVDYMVMGEITVYGY
jgi:hypothetical protein